MTSPPNNRKELEEILQSIFNQVGINSDDNRLKLEATQAIEHLVLSARIEELKLIKWHGSRTQESIRAGVRRKDWKETHDKTMQVIRKRIAELKGDNNNDAKL